MSRALNAGERRKTNGACAFKVADAIHSVSGMVRAELVVKGVTLRSLVHVPQPCKLTRSACPAIGRWIFGVAAVCVTAGLFQYGVQLPQENSRPEVTSSLAWWSLREIAHEA